VQLLFVAIGLFTIAGAALDWDWFMTNRKAQFFVDTFGRDGARIFYGILGCVIILMGAMTGR